MMLCQMTVYLCSGLLTESVTTPDHHLRVEAYRGKVTISRRPSDVGDIWETSVQRLKKRKPPADRFHALEGVLGVSSLRR